MRFRRRKAARIEVAGDLGDALPRTSSTFGRVPELVLYSISPLATLITAPLLAHGLGPVGRGQYGVATAVGMFALTLGAWGQAETYLGEARAGRLSVKQQSRITWVGGTIVGVLTAIALIGLGIPVLTSVLTAVWVPLLAQANVWRAVCVALGRLKEPALFNAVGPIARVLLLLVLTWLAILNVDTAVTATQAALAVAAVTTMWLVVRRLPKHHDSELVPVRTLLHSGGSIITFSLLNAITLRADLVILQLFASANDVGLIRSAGEPHHRGPRPVCGIQVAHPVGRIQFALGRLGGQRGAAGARARHARRRGAVVHRADPRAGVLRR